MAEDNSEVQLTWETLPSIVKTGLIIVATEQNFKSYEVDLESGSKLGDGYMSVILRATIRGTKTENDLEHKFSVLCKMQLLSTARRELSNSNRAFEREVLIYNEFLPAIEALQKEHGITQEEGFYCFPKCYYAEFDKETKDAVLILQDMRDDGYQLGNKYKPLDVDTCRLVMQGLGRLHALTFALKVYKPEMFEKIKGYEDILAEIMVKKEMDAMWDMVFKQALDALGDSYPDVTEKIKQIKGNLENEFKSLMGSDISGIHSAVLHGDSWTNNFLFKSENNKHNEVIFIDWQISRYASPVLDIVYFLFNCTDKETRDADYDNLLRTYHNSFSNILKKFNEDPNYYFSYDKLQEHLQLFGKYGLMMSLCLIPFTTIPPEELPNLDKAMEDFVKQMDKPEQSQMLKVAEASSKRVESRLRDIILDIDRFGYLQNNK